MNQSPKNLALCAFCALFVVACASTTDAATSDSTTTDDEVVETIPTTVAPEVTTTVAPEATSPTATAADVETTPGGVTAEEFGSVGNVLIGDVQYDFDFECFAEGESDVLALGAGEAPGSDVGTQAIVQLLSGQAFVSVLIEGQQTLELALDAPAELFLRDGVIRGTALRFVDAGAEVGVGEPLGLGEVTVTCESFAPELPDGFNVS